MLQGFRRAVAARRMAVSRGVPTAALAGAPPLRLEVEQVTPERAAKMPEVARKAEQAARAGSSRAWSYRSPRAYAPIPPYGSKARRCLKYRAQPRKSYFRSAQTSST